MLHQKLFWLLTLLLPVQLGRHFWPEWSYVLGLRVDYLAPTVYLTDLLVVGILVSWWWQAKKSYTLFRAKRETRFSDESRRLLYAIRYTLQRYWWVIAIFLYLLINSLLAQNPGAALYKFAKIIEFSLLGFYIARTKPNVSRLTSYLSLAVAYSSLIAIAQFIKQASLNGIFWWLGERTFTIATPGIAKAIIGGRLLMRPYATFPHPNVLAGFILVAIILLLGNFKSTNQLINKFKSNWLIGIYWILVFILALTGLVISFSRSVWIVGTLSLLPITYHLLPNKKRRIIVIFGLVFLGLISVFCFAPQFSTEEAISQRVELIKIAFQMIQNSPLTGIGLNNFVVRLPEFWTVQSIYWLQPVHNIFLLIAAETSLVGLLIFTWLLILTFIKLLEIGNWHFEEISRSMQLVIPLLAILLTGVADHYWLTLQQSQLLFTIILGLSWTKKLVD